MKDSGEKLMTECFMSIQKSYVKYLHNVRDKIQSQSSGGLMSSRLGKDIEEIQSVVHKSSAMFLLAGFGSLIVMRRRRVRPLWYLMSIPAATFAGGITTFFAGRRVCMTQLARDDSICTDALCMYARGLQPCLEDFQCREKLNHQSGAQFEGTLGNAMAGRDMVMRDGSAAPYSDILLATLARCRRIDSAKKLESGSGVSDNGHPGLEFEDAFSRESCANPYSPDDRNS